MMREKRSKVPRCVSCRWWDRSNNFRSVEKDWGLCHFWGGRTGMRTPRGFIDGTFGHEPSGADTCDWHNADPSKKAEAQLSGAMPELKCEGNIQWAKRATP
jgi:hypothetical protein